MSPTCQKRREPPPRPPTNHLHNHPRVILKQRSRSDSDHLSTRSTSCWSDTDTLTVQRSPSRSISPPTVKHAQACCQIETINSQPIVKCRGGSVRPGSRRSKERDDQEQLGPRSLKKVRLWNLLSIGRFDISSSIIPSS
eukprot:sb/3474388/